ncbi:MAG: hypothetical protein M1381_08150 [Deltaproteobacteria bacterium]|nr:hypothetical protein [Deltaproteobacteria bacterium]
MTIDASGNVWVANWNSNSVTKIVGLATGPQYFPYTGPQWPWKVIELNKLDSVSSTE